MKTKKLLVAFCLTITGCAFPYGSAHAETISKRDILSTVKHIQALASEQKAQLIKAQDDYLKQGDQLLKAQAEAIQKAKEAHENAKQRDVVLIAFGIIAGFWIGSLFGGEVLRQFPFPYGPIACIAIYIAAGIGAYTMGRYLLATLSHLIP